ncbi:MAG: hypothetical protein E6G94_11945 [Alphaproteobacteria bacterium]|nr:MAG: hypothetical protein E6G94_11945 [Alphaproteobacteria bacterium]
MGEEADKALMGAKLSGFLLGKITGVDPFNEVMKAFSGGQGADFEGFFHDVIARLDAIKGELDQVQDAIAGVAATETKILLSIEDVKFQDALSDYNLAANLLKQFYADWRSAAAALRSDDDQTRRKGAQLLRKTLGDDSSDKVGEAIRNIGTFLIGEGPFRGALSYLPGLLESGLRDLALNQPVKMTIQGEPCYDSFYTCQNMASRYATIIDSDISPLFEAALASLHMGITLLEMTYVGTIQENQLDEPRALIQKTCNYIHDFWFKLATTPGLEDGMAKAFQIGKKTLSRPLREAQWSSWDSIHESPEPGESGFPAPPEAAGWAVVAADPYVKLDFPLSERLMALIPPDLEFKPDQRPVSQVMFTNGNGYVLFGSCKGRTPIDFAVPSAVSLFGIQSKAPSLVDICQRLEDAGLVAPRQDPAVTVLAVEAGPAETEVMRLPLA